MRRLSVRQAMNCENAIGHTCKCRCGGALHGAARMPKEDDPLTWLNGLGMDDPHYRPMSAREHSKVKKELIAKFGQRTDDIPF